MNESSSRRPSTSDARVEARDDSLVHARVVSSKDLIVGTLVSLAAAAAMLAPMFGPLENDSFPLSTFPMFTRHRGKPVMHQLLGIERDGGERRLTPELLGTSEVLQAKVLIDRAAGSQERSARLCRSVAQRVARSGEHSQLTALELRRVRFDPVAYFSQGRTPIESKRLHRCRVDHLPPSEAP